MWSQTTVWTSCLHYAKQHSNKDLPGSSGLRRVAARDWRYCPFNDMTLPGSIGQVCHPPVGISTRLVPGNSIFEFHPDLWSLDVGKAAPHVKYEQWLLLCVPQRVVVTANKRRYERASRALKQRGGQEVGIFSLDGFNHAQLIFSLPSKPCLCWMPCFTPTCCLHPFPPVSALRGWPSGSLSESLVWLLVGFSERGALAGD